MKDKQEIMNFLQNYLQEKLTRQQKINIAYLVAGYPNKTFTQEVLKNLFNLPIDILELGIPYFDPLADGKIIARASFEAAQKNITTDTVFDMLDEMKAHKKKPLLFLVYYNLILAYGEENFLQKAKAAGIDGFIVPDLPYEESFTLSKLLHLHNMNLIPLVSPTSQNRIEKILSPQDAIGGFVYAIGSIGITGGKQVESKRLQNFIAEIKSKTELPVAIGFGVKTKEDITNLKKIADGVIVGTSLVEKSAGGDTQKFFAFVRELFG